MAQNADFELNVGFNTQKLDQAKKEFQDMLSGEFSGGGGRNDSTKQQKQTSVVAAGFSKALKITGLIGVVTGLSFILDTLGALLGLLTFFVLSGIVEFYRDPVRSLLQLGVFIVNGILSGLEAFANFILPGQPVELPRFQTDLVLEAFDNYRDSLTEAAEDGKVSTGEAFSAYKEFSQNLQQSFITNSDYQELVNEAALQNKEVAELAFNSTDDLMTTIAEGATGLATSASNMFERTKDKFDSLFDESSDKADDLPF